MRIRAGLAGLAWLLSLAGMARAAPMAAPVPIPAEHGDFDHYTFALTWQPGFCATGGGCAADQPHAPLIGLHGLWASLPGTLARRGVADPAWWAAGCDMLGPRSEAEPPIDPALHRAVEAVMPQVKGDLLRHEYDKHVQCFGFDAAGFFRAELAMRERIDRSAWAASLRGDAGQVVEHAALVDAFEREFATRLPRAIQLECRTRPDGQAVLTQFWITIARPALARFPAGGSLVDPPENQDTCPARLTVPAWPS